MQGKSSWVRVVLYSLAPFLLLTEYGFSCWGYGLYPLKTHIGRTAARMSAVVPGFRRLLDFLNI